MKDQLEKIIEEILNELKKQKFLVERGDADTFDVNNTKNDWIAYLTAYLGRASDKVYRNEREEHEFRTTLIKVGVLLLSAIEAHDNGLC